jgi:cobalamin biosynthetic protein CobC
LNAGLQEHGGNLAAAMALYPKAPRPWLDLSTGINPYAFPFEELPRSLFARLPDPFALAALEGAAARNFGVNDPLNVVAAAGTQALIQCFPSLLAARKIGIFGLTYNEYARVFTAYGSEVSICETLNELERADAAIIVNPNNPDGRLIAAPDILALGARLAAEWGALIVDEAFIEMQAEAVSVAASLPQMGGIVLRSFGKAYGLAGVRLGFAVVSQTLAGRLRERLGPWPVSGPALAIGHEAFARPAWLAECRKKLVEDAAWLDDCLIAAGFCVTGGTLLFRLTKHPEAGRHFERLCQAGILVRAFRERKDWLRFGIPLGEETRRRLREALTLGNQSK